MKTLREELKVFDFIDYENEEPITVESYHIDDVLKAVKEWLTQKRQWYYENFSGYTAQESLIDELLGELEPQK